MAYKQKKSMIAGTDPVKKARLEKVPNPTTKADVKPERDEQEFMNEQDYQSVPTFTNSNPSPNDKALANAKKKKDTPVKPKKGDMKKYSDLEKNDDDK
tara:strand:- start:134 stop:427 length:294 start_codon:yes stop_codon:yes gene_type:complete